MIRGHCGFWFRENTRIVSVFHFEFNRDHPRVPFSEMSL